MRLLLLTLLLIGCASPAPVAPPPAPSAAATATGSAATAAAGTPAATGVPTTPVAASAAPVVAGVGAPALAAIATQVAREAPTATAAAVAGAPLPLPSQPSINQPPGPRPTPSPEAGRFLGRDPLPSGVDLSQGPFLRQLQAAGAAGVNRGDGQLGDALHATYLAALLIEQTALNAGDGTQLSAAFTGPALSELRARLAAPTDQMPRRVVLYQPRVMSFMPLGSGLAFTLVDARTETFGQSTDGTTESVRECYLISLRWQAGRWLIEGIARQHGGRVGKYCPPGWS